MRISDSIQGPGAALTHCVTSLHSCCGLVVLGLPICQLGGSLDKWRGAGFGGCQMSVTHIGDVNYSLQCRLGLGCRVYGYGQLLERSRLKKSPLRGQNHVSDSRKQLSHPRNLDSPLSGRRNAFSAILHNLDGLNRKRLDARRLSRRSCGDMQHNSEAERLFVANTVDNLVLGWNNQ